MNIDRLKQANWFCIASLMILASFARTDPVDAGQQANKEKPPIGSIKKTRIAKVTDNFPKRYRDAFDRYVQVIAPNGKPINIFAQKEITDAQIRHVRDVMVHFLTDFPGSKYGVNKGAIANRMAVNGATMMICKGHDGQYREPRIQAQPLYADETIVEGTDAYIKNQFEGHRDASLEEILHCVHDNGIGVDFRGAPKGVLPKFQKELRAATKHAMKKGIWPTKSAQRRASGWIEELRQEGSLTQEYLASVIDSYYGLWGPFEKDFGMWGIYVARERKDIQKKDPRGYAIVETFFQPYLTYNAEIDSSFQGTFSMTFDKGTPYTHKSRYLLHAHLTGNHNSNLTGNNQNNTLAGNSGDNTIDGGEGKDTVVFSKPKSDYEITKNEDGSLTVVGDGTDKLINIEKLVFDGAKLDTAQYVAPVPFGQSGSGIRRKGIEQSQGEEEPEGEESVEALMQQLDRNKDGKLQRTEVPKSNHNEFDAADVNGDDVVTLGELKAAFQRDEVDENPQDSRPITAPSQALSNFTNETATFDFSGRLGDSFPKNPRWSSNKAKVTVKNKAAYLTATGNSVCETWHAWKKPLPVDKSWVVQADVAVPREWEKADGNDPQVGIGLFVGKPEGSVAKTVYEVNMAVIGGRARFVQAQMIRNRLGGDPVDVVASEIKDHTVRLSILYCKPDRSLSVFVNSNQLSSHPIDASGVVNWKLSDKSKLDVGFMGFAENTNLEKNSPSIRNFKILEIGKDMK